MSGDSSAPLRLGGRFQNRRQRAIELQRRMLVFREIYNAGYLLRDSWHGSALRHQECVRRFADALARELQQKGSDHEALVYAVADAIYASPLGVPWEP